MSQLNIHSLMDGDIARVAEANHALSRLWRLTLWELNVRSPSWDGLMTDYINRAKEPLGKVMATNLKGNLPKGLAKLEITFKRFCQGISVLQFYKVVFRLRLTKGDKKGEVSIVIPETFKSDAGKYLKTLWQELIVVFPHAVGDWPGHLNIYKEKYAQAYGVKTDSLNSNLSSSLEDEELTWNTFYQGLMVHDFDEISIELDLYRRTRKNIANSIILGLKKA